MSLTLIAQQCFRHDGQRGQVSPASRSANVLRTIRTPRLAFVVVWAGLLAVHTPLSVNLATLRAQESDEALEASPELNVDGGLEADEPITADTPLENDEESSNEEPIDGASPRSEENAETDGAAAALLNETAVRDTLANLLRNRPETTVQAALLGSSDDPAMVVKAIDILAGVGEEAAALELIRAQLRQGLEGDGLKKAAAAADSKFLIKLFTRPGLQPEGKQLATLLSDVRQSVRNADWYADRVRKMLASGQGMEEQLLTLGAKAIPALVSVAAEDPDTGGENAQVQRANSALAYFASNDSAPLLAYVDLNNSSEAVVIARALTHAASRDALERIAAWSISSKVEADVRQAAAQSLAAQKNRALDQSEIERFLMYRLNEYRKRLHSAPISGASINVWRRKGNQLIQTEIPQRLDLCNRIANVTLPWADTNTNAGEWHLLAQLESDDYTRGINLDTPGSDVSKGSGPLDEAKNVDEQSGQAGLEAGETARLLEMALEQRLMGAALQLVIQLEKNGDASFVVSSPGKPTAIVQACSASDRRVRLAALKCIAQWKPESPFNGRETIKPALDYLAASKGKRVIATHLFGAFGGRSLSRYLPAAEMTVVDCASLYELRKEVFTNPDVELIVCDAGGNLPDLRVLLSELRADCRSALIPIVIACEAERVDTIRAIAQDFSRCDVWIRAQDEKGSQLLLSRLQGMAWHGDVTVVGRLTQAQTARELIQSLNTVEEPPLEDGAALQQTGTTQNAMSRALVYTIGAKPNP